ncbi:MAG: hypothetical protein L6V95_04845 [Candidatus Melainabacteria bacterium]|nr:MAG: hypothetical protein L6V95_04845 [Candidatus Melainabacteria bacterium]
MENTAIKEQGSDNQGLKKFSTFQLLNFCLGFWTSICLANENYIIRA